MLTALAKKCLVTHSVICTEYKFSLHFPDIRTTHLWSPGWPEVWPPGVPLAWAARWPPAAWACCHTHSHPLHTSHSTRLHKQSCPAVERSAVDSVRLVSRPSPVSAATDSVANSGSVEHVRMATQPLTGKFAMESVSAENRNKHNIFKRCQSRNMCVSHLPACMGPPQVGRSWQ